MIIIGFDPGETTGVCVLVVEKDKGDGFVADAFTIAWQERFEIIELIAEYPEAVIVAEDFRLYEAKARSQINSRFPSSQIIGIIEAAVFVSRGSVNVVYQMASCISRVQVLEMHRPVIPHSPHMEDAYKHARYYSVMHRGKST